MHEREQQWFAIHNAQHYEFVLPDPWLVFIEQLKCIVARNVSFSLGLNVPWCATLHCSRHCTILTDVTHTLISQM
jgi:hypothetical protein